MRNWVKKIWKKIKRVLRVRRRDPATVAFGNVYGDYYV